jgi:hypothetical protein
VRRHAARLGATGANGLALAQDTRLAGPRMV